MSIEAIIQFAIDNGALDDENLRQAIREAEEQAPWDAYDKAMAEQAQPVAATWRTMLPGGKRTDKWDSARVADYNAGWNDFRKAAKSSLEKLEAAPPPRQPWVGLTEEERNDLEDYCEMIIGKAAFEAIETKLKAKNSL